MAKIVLPIIVIALVLGGAFFYMSSRQNLQPNEVVVSTEPSNLKVPSQSGGSTSDSRYLEYSKANLEEKGNTRRVLFFYANWCPICKPADSSFKENGRRIPSDLTIIRVNYNDSDTDQEEKNLAAKYLVTYQHTFVQIDANGEVVAKWNGGGVEDLLKNIK